MPSDSRHPTDPDAYAVARRLHDAADATRNAFDRIAAELDLTPPQARLILRLFEPTAMGDVAGHLACDKSNVTGIAARLGDRGFVTAGHGSDRRVKLLELTAQGQQIRASLEQHIADTSPATTRLTRPERRALIRLLDKLSSTATPAPRPTQQQSRR